MGERFRRRPRATLETDKAAGLKVIDSEGESKMFEAGLTASRIWPDRGFRYWFNCAILAAPWWPGDGRWEMTLTPEDIERAALLLGKVDDDYSDTDHESVRDAYRNTAEVILTDHYRRLAERGAEVVEWRPASLAPRDGTMILARFQYTTRSNAFDGEEAVIENEYGVCKIDEETGDLLDWHGNDMGWKFDEVATHFMLLPAPPKENKP